MDNAGSYTLYDYWRSSASYRVRIALNLKGLGYEQRSVHLAEGQQQGDEYKAVNPQGLVPALAQDSLLLTQSLAICEYLDEKHPEPPLLPSDARGRALVRSLAQLVAVDIHPLNNLRVLKYLKGPLGADGEGVSAWYHHWVAEGFAALESRLASGRFSGSCCYGDVPGLADIALIPQVYNAERFECDLAPFPRIRAITEHCRGLEAFARAAPERQADAVS